MDCIEHEHKEKYYGLPVKENEADPIQSLGWVKICHPVLPDPNPHISENEARFKYIDDKVAAEAIKISDLKPMTDVMERPLNYRDRTLHQIPTNPGLLQKRLKEIDKFCEIQKMKINEKKSLTAVFNVSTSRDFYPRMSNAEGSIYDNTEEFKLLGVDFVSHPRLGIKWDKYILKCIKQAYSNMWILKRLNEIGVSRQDMLMTYQGRIRAHLERHAPLFHFSINQKLSEAIEKVQKMCAFVILGKTATSSYSKNLAILGLETMRERRDKLCSNLAKKSLKRPVHKSMFTWNERRQTRSNRKVIVPPATTQRYDRSSIPSLARIINSL